MSESVVTHLIGQGLEEKELWVERSKKEKSGMEGVQRKCHKFLLELTCLPFFVLKTRVIFTLYLFIPGLDPPDSMQSPLWAALVLPVPVGGPWRFFGKWPKLFLLLLTLSLKLSQTSLASIVSRSAETSLFSSYLPAGSLFSALKHKHPARAWRREAQDSRGAERRLSDLD